MNVAFASVPSDTRIDGLELLDHAVEFREVSSRGSQRVRRVKRHVENRAGDRGVECLELLEKIFNLFRRQLRQSHDDLTLDQAELRLQSFGLVSQQFAHCAPCRTIPQRRSVELEHELTRDALSQPRRNSRSSMALSMCARRIRRLSVSRPPVSIGVRRRFSRRVAAFAFGVSCMVDTSILPSTG